MNVAGATNASFTNIPANNDEISCILVSNAACVVNNPAVSNAVVILVASYPTLNVLENLTINQSTCFDALQTISVAGDGSTFTIESGGSVTMIAGQQINYLPGTHIMPGAYLHGFITTTGEFCGTQAPSSPGVTQNDPPDTDGGTASSLHVFPNPTDGVFEVEINGLNDEETSRLEIYSMTGEKVASTDLHGTSRQDISLSGKPAGIYLIKAASGKKSGTARIVKR